MGEPRLVVPRVFVTPAGKADLADAENWYATHSPQMIPIFRKAFRAVVKRIETNPRQFSLAQQQTRKALVRRFPYLVLFRETEHAAYVVAVFHTRRDPRRR